MLTPRFELNQTEDHITIIIHAPYVRVADTEIYMQENDFRFYCNPYYLRLHLPGEIEENAHASAKYDYDSKEFVIVAPKVMKGQNFEGLDLLTSLLTPKECPGMKKPIIEVTGSYSSEESPSTEEVEDDFDWFIEQKIPAEPEICIESSKYGFGNNYSGVFQKLGNELSEVVDIPDPDFLTVVERRLGREEAEKTSFNCDHYLADWALVEELRPVFDFKPWWTEKQESSEIMFSENEQRQMRCLQNRDYLLDTGIEKSTYLGMVDILFAYSYNHRTLEGVNSVESPWTVAKLSATFSWLDTFTDLKDVMISCFRRSLCYPLYRNWDLCVQVWKDVQAILHLGKRMVLKCFLEIHKIFNECDPYYLLNQLYMDDYCVWVQKCSDEKLKSLKQAVVQVSPNKNDVGLELVEFEQAALLVMEEERKRVESRLCINNCESDVAISVDKIMEVPSSEENEALKCLANTNANNNRDQNKAEEFSEREAELSEETETTGSTEISEEESLDSDDISE